MESTVGPGKSEILRCPRPPKVSVVGTPVCVCVGEFVRYVCMWCVYMYQCGTCAERGCRWARTDATPAVTAEAAMSAGPRPKYPLPPERLPPKSQAQRPVEPPGGDRRPSWCQSQCGSQEVAPHHLHAPGRRGRPQGGGEASGRLGARRTPGEGGVCRGWAPAGRRPQGAPSHLPTLALCSACPLALGRPER